MYIRQEDAFQAIEQAKRNLTGHSNLRVFSLEVTSKSSTGSRRYVVLDYIKFWIEYKDLKAHRHFYELIREHSPARLYFDIEFETEFNPNLDGLASLRLMLDLLFESLASDLGISYAKSAIIDLRSSSSAKFSHHLVLSNVVFVNNVDMGIYIKHFVLQIFQRLKLEHDGLQPDQKNEPSRYERLFPLNEDGERRSMIDTAVYTKNRNFRLWKSSKLGKQATLEVGELDTVFRGDIDEYFHRTLVVPSPTELKTINLVSFAKKAEELYRSSGYGQPTVAPVNIPPVLKVKVPRAATNDGAAVLTGQSTTTPSSPFPDLEMFLAGELRSWPGASRAVLRGWRTVEGSGSITFNVGNNRWCERVSREHKSNHIFIICNLRLRNWFQSCHDPECRAVQFEGTLHTIPWDIPLPGYSAFEDLDRSFEISDFDPDEIAQHASNPPKYVDIDENSMDVDFPVSESEFDFDPDAVLAARQQH